MPTQIRAVVITVSDACSAGERQDASRGALVGLLTELGAEIVAKVVVNDDLEPLAHKLRAYADLKYVNRIVSTGAPVLVTATTLPKRLCKRLNAKPQVSLKPCASRL